MAIAITVLSKPGPSTATIATASSSEGRAIITSIIRMISGPKRCGKNAANKPSKMPGSSEQITEDRPISSDKRAP